MSDWLPAAPLAGAAAGYTAGAARLALRGDAWPVRRTVAALVGVVVLAVALLPPLAAADEDLHVHVVQHLLLTVAGPLLLTLGAPVTLVLRAVRTPSRRRLSAVLHSRPVRLLVHPATVLVLDVGSLYALYLTPLFEATGRSEALHAFVHTHMLATGLLFAAVVAGSDPLPGRPGVAVRLGLVVVTGAAHDALAKILYGRGWGGAAELLFYGGEAADVLFALAVLAGWYARGGRDLARTSRRLVNAS